MLQKIALAWWLCACGAQWRNEELRLPDGTQKSDEDLAIETGREFERHREVYER